MNAALNVTKVLLFASVASGIFLAFGWPFVVSADPASESFRIVAVATLIGLLVSLSVVIVLNAALGRVRTSRKG